MTDEAWDFDENSPVESNRQKPPSDTCQFCGHYHREPTSGNAGRCWVQMPLEGGRTRRCRCHGEPPPEAPSLEGLFWAAPNRNKINTIHAYLPNRPPFGLCGRGGCFLEGDIIFQRDDQTGEQRFCLWCASVIHGVLKGTRTELPR